MFTATPPRRMSTSLRVLAALLGYPDARMRECLPQMRRLLVDEDALSASRRVELEALFDRGRATSLHLFEHVHGDSRDRGPAMIDLCKTYESAGLFLGPKELPDYLPVILEFCSTQPPREARAFLGEIAHILSAIFAALRKRESDYASVLGALIELAGEKAQPVEPAAEEELDASWTEPPVFDGCSVKGQAAPGQAQPIHVVRSARAADPGIPTRAGAAR
jgi:nitrate reductase delta subunit